MAWEQKSRAPKHQSHSGRGKLSEVALDPRRQCPTHAGNRKSKGFCENQDEFERCKSHNARSDLSLLLQILEKEEPQPSAQFVHYAHWGTKLCPASGPGRARAHACARAHTHSHTRMYMCK